MRYFGLDPVESANRKKEQESATLHVVFCPSSVRRRYRVHGFSVGWCAHVRCYLREVLESRRRADLTAGDLGRVDLGGCPPRSPSDPGLHITRTRFLTYDFAALRNRLWTTRGLG